MALSVRDAGCGGTIQATRGVIKSPMFPNYYPSYRDCYWTIIVPVGRYIEFTFGFLEIEPSANCTKDYLQVRVIPASRSRLPSVRPHQLKPVRTVVPKLC